MAGATARAARQTPLSHTPDEVPTPFEAQIEEEIEAGMKEADRDVYLEWLFPDNQEW